MQPLKGLTVVTLEHAIAAPFATRQLADLGARVIKIERPGTGDFARGYDARVRGLASHFVWTNRSKESLTLDVKHPEAAKVLERLVLEKADVVVQNLAPGAAARIVLGFDGLAAKLTLIFAWDIPDYGANGDSVMLGLQNEREWVNFCDKVLQRPELARDPRFTGNAKRVAERTALRGLIVETFASLTAPQVVERLEAAQIANARVNTMHEVWEHPQLRARDRWREVGSPAGPLPAMLPPGTWDGGPRMDPVPALGGHSDAVLREL